jgi:hypothetical protein
LINERKGVQYKKNTDCCNYTNLQPLLITDNLEKSNKWNDEKELYWKENIINKEYHEIYI